MMRLKEHKSDTKTPYQDEQILSGDGEGDVSESEDEDDNEQTLQSIKSLKSAGSNKSVKSVAKRHRNPI